jgi:hypothetical protein
MSGHPGIGRLVAGAIALIAGIAVLLQVMLVIETVCQQGRSTLDGIHTAFSYFTVLTNTIVALVAGATAWRGEDGSFLTRPATRAAVTIYILVVGAIFAALLTGLREMNGLTLAVDNTLHRIVPVLFVLYWLFLVPKGQLSWQDPLKWMIYPALYIVYSLVNGALSGRYFYPFSDVTVLGYGAVLVNGALILIGFYILGLIIVTIDRAASRTGRPES